MRTLQLQFSQAFTRLLETDSLMLSLHLPALAPASGMSSVQKCHIHSVLTTWQHWGHFQGGTELETLPASEQTPDQRPSIFKMLSVGLSVKVIPLKLFYYQTFLETWHS